MKRIACIILIIVLSACTSIGMSTDYAGRDAGYLIIGIGAIPDSDFQSYSLIFKSTATGQRGSLTFMQGSIMKDTPQYQNEFGRGVVKTASLPAGKYELCNYSAIRGNGIAGVDYFSKEDFSVPFEVKAGETVYLGNFEAFVTFHDGPLGIKVSQWKGFKVRDLAGQDLKIANEKDRNISTVTFTNATPSSKSINGAFF